MKKIKATANKVANYFMEKTSRFVWLLVGCLACDRILAAIFNLP